MNRLIQQLKQLDGKGYKGYKSVQGHYKFPKYDLYIDYVQGDPFASPSKIRVVISKEKRAIHSEWLLNKYRKVATEDRLAREVGKAVLQNRTFIKGSGKSGAVLFDTPGQEILERTAVQITSSQITICLSVGFPANGRRINGKEAIKLLAEVIPSIIENSIFSISNDEIEKAVKLQDQQQAIRKEMADKNWVAFIANGSILPRESGVSNRTLKGAIPFQSPPENEVSITIPHQQEPIVGMAIPKGITLIVGGGYHGKSTFLEALERGVYTHTKEDGREFVLTDPEAVKIRAEDGRKITGVNISPFIKNLPHGQNTVNFSTENASGSTSQAANVIEALEVGASTLLIDEDTSATNFMIRDYRMQKLVTQDKEPITPFIDKITQLKRDLGTSTILVMGGSGDYFDTADTVIMMDEYVPRNVTEKAREITQQFPSERKSEKESTFGEIVHRQFQQNSLQTQKGKRSKTQAKGLTTILMGKTEISFNHTEQLVDSSQTRMIAEMIQYLDRKKNLEKQSLHELLNLIDDQIDKHGLASFTVNRDQHPGDLARPRRYEIASVINRMRTAKVKQL
ncbi:ABC-ATPase domain-containing protein [Ornithinibacillus halophilus]|uniref:Predicted ATPase of the ABC class n=1 Tax=Ornithinibacillus halophilus TaxID=930117 RepID=A0A1M5HWD1_9BACI|nr:ABC-ATPase domain-containing protein [Ornithinibacillus halophilus]SHG20172.1 Predicted ATPase of the ABC class [Ornithinibacillus halophilus]